MNVKIFPCCQRILSNHPSIRCNITSVTQLQVSENENFGIKSLVPGLNFDELSPRVSEWRTKPGSFPSLSNILEVELRV